MPDALAERLLGLMALECRLVSRDGHIWIESTAYEDDDDWDNAPALAHILRKGGIALNNKIYGGVLEALDTIDAALHRANHNWNLRDIGAIRTDMDGNGRYFLGHPGVDESRIDTKARGGIY